MTTTKKSDCDVLVEESEKLLHISLKQAADMFYAAAECYDAQEHRILAARYFALAGQTYNDLKTRRGTRKAASAYGKAITRYLMADDLQGASFLLDKGKGQEFNTYHFKMAEDSLERKIQEIGITSPESQPLEEGSKSEIAIPKVSPISEPVELPSEITDVLIEQEEVMPVLETFSIADPIDEIPAEIGRALLESVSEDFKPSITLDSSSTVEFITSTGEKKILKPEKTLIPIKDSIQLSSDLKGLSDELVLVPEDVELNQIGVLTDTALTESIEDSPLKDLERETTAFDSVSEVLNELEDPITDVEVVDHIPFAWQVVGVEAGDLKLMKREVVADGLLFSWTKNRLTPGERVQIKYHLRKRIHRSTVVRQGQKISLLSTYHSINEKGKTLLNAEIPYTNVSGEVIDEVLIEDTLPAELIPRSYQPKVSIPAMISGVDSTLFRWLLREVHPGFHIDIAYDFVEKPLTRWFERQFEGERGARVRVKKIAQPNQATIHPEMLLFFELNASLPAKLEVLDEIPSDAEVVAVEPSWLMPKIVSERNQKFLLWFFDLQTNDRARIIIRLRSLSDYAAFEPIIRFSDYEIAEGREIQKKREKQILDLRLYADSP